MLGHAIRRVHELPLPPGSEATGSVAFLARIWSGLAGFVVPGFVGEAVERMLAEPVPGCDRPSVLSHNDLNPSNLAYDGERLVLLDWDVAGPNDAFYDLAAVAVFLRMDDATSAQLIAAYDDAPVAALPPRFAYDRRLIAAMCGAIFVDLAPAAGPPRRHGEARREPRARRGASAHARAGVRRAERRGPVRLFGLALAKARASRSSFPVSRHAR